MCHDDDPTPASEPSESSPDHERGGASACLRTSIQALAAGEGNLHFGGGGSGTLAEAREAQLTFIAALPRFAGDTGEHIATGGEHMVHLSTDGQRVFKFTRAEEFGFCIDEVVVFDARTFLSKPKLMHRQALPSE